MGESGAALFNSLVALVSGAISGALGGYFAGRAQLRYQLRVSTIVELRTLMIEVQRAFDTWIMHPAYTGGPGDLHQGAYVGAKIDALSSYYRAHDDWLDSKSRESVERILQGFGAHYHAHMKACSIEDWLTEQRETARAADSWLSGELPDLMEEVRPLPRWRRMFGS